MHADTTRPAGSESPSLDPAEVCTLPAGGLEDRLAWIRDEILPHVVETVRLDRGLAFELAMAPGLSEKLDRLIELERECCSGISFECAASATPGRLRLEVRGIDPDTAIFRSLRVPAAPPPAGARVAKAAGIGALASFFVCCVLPVAALALLGAAAAPLASLDGPGPIAAGALIGGTVAWWLLGRRHPRSSG